MFEATNLEVSPVDVRLPERASFGSYEITTTLAAESDPHWVIEDDDEVSESQWYAD